MFQRERIRYESETRNNSALSLSPILTAKQDDGTLKCSTSLITLISSINQEQNNMTSSYVGVENREQQTVKPSGHTRLVELGKVKEQRNKLLSIVNVKPQDSNRCKTSLQLQFSVV